MGSDDAGIGFGRELEFRVRTRISKITGFSRLGGLTEDPLSGHLFVFSNRNRTRVKLLYWDGSGTWILTKRLEKGRFSWPRDDGGPATPALRILAEELTMLLSGIDLEKTRSRAWWRKAA